MIQIIVRIVPNGDRGRAVEHAVAEVMRAAGDTVCDYAVSAGENQNPVTGADDWSSRGHVLGHDRQLSVWELVARVAAWAAAEAYKAARQ
jgi:hypothetical protein